MPSPRASLPWHTGRTFYACPCGAQEETHVDNVPAPQPVLDCYYCHAAGSMRQWTPPSVTRSIAA